ncbi:MAG: tryptophan synthase subunit beta [Patescibacteria group bacterium]
MMKKGYFGKFGGMFVSELLVKPLQEVTVAFEKFKKNRPAQKELKKLLRDYVGRPTPLYYAKNLSEKFGFNLFLKREDLIHGGAHKTNNTVGQAFLAKQMGKRELIAETGAGQHGFAVALAGALSKIPVKIFMGEKDIERQRMNVQRMKLCGAEIIPVKSGSQTLKDAINEALRYYVSNSEKTYYLFGTAAGPHPFPSIVRYFQKIIGEETRRQIKEKIGRLPDYVIACVGGGSNAIGIFSAFLRDKNVRLIGAEAKGGASLNKGVIGSLHGAISYCLQDNAGQILESQSVAAGLDYPGVGPEHSALKDAKRVQYFPITDAEALKAFHLLCEEEGIIPALESAHAVAYAAKLKGKLPRNATVIVNLSGRGDKDLDTIFQ